MKSILIAGLGLACAPAFATIAFVNSPFVNNDSVTWSQLGGDGTAIPQSFSVTSLGSLSISGTFTGANGGTVLVIPGSWPATPGSFNSGDSLIWTGDGSGLNNGPLTLSFPAVITAGLWLQADVPGSFTAQIQVFEGATSSTFSASSASGSPLFLGGTETTSAALVTKIVLSLTSCGGGTCTTSDLKDFAADTMFLKTAVATPEPGALTLLGVGLAGLVFSPRKKSHVTKRTL